jgi:hypothetical protein
VNKFKEAVSLYTAHRRYQARCIHYKELTSTYRIFLTVRWVVCCTFGMMHAGFWWGNLRENRGVDGRINIKMDIKEVGLEASTGYG